VQPNRAAACRNSSLLKVCVPAPRLLFSYVAPQRGELGGCDWPDVVPWLAVAGKNSLKTLGHASA